MEKQYHITVSSPDSGDKDKRHIVTHEVTGKGVSPIGCYNNAVKQVNEMIGKKKGHEITRINGPRVIFGSEDSGFSRLKKKMKL